MRESTLTDRTRTDEREDAGNASTDIGEGMRGVVAPSRGGTFDSTPGESGDTTGAERGGPGVSPSTPSGPPERNRP